MQQPIQKQAYALGAYGIKPNMITEGCFILQTKHLHSASCPNQDCWALGSD